MSKPRTEEQKARYKDYQRKWRKENRDRCAGYSRAYRKRNPDAPRNTHLKGKYGITIEDHANMLSTQDNRCAICGAAEPGCVDHCHTSGVVRGLLCRNCNLMLGHARDNPAVLSAGIQYLKAYQNGEETEAAIG